MYPRCDRVTEFDTAISSEETPREEALDAARQARHELSLKICLVDKRILSLHQQLAALESEKALLNNSVRPHDLVLSPIRRVPDDVLREIFLDCLPPEMERYLFVTSASHAPMLLTHVCRRWRRVSTSYSLLWRWVSVSLNAIGGTGIDVLTEVIARAKLCPLKLQVLHWYFRLHPHSQPFSFSEFLNRGRASHFLTSLVLSEVPLNCIRTIPSSSLPSLESLVLHLHVNEVYGDLTRPITAFQDCPALQRVAVNKCFTSTELSLPWNQLTHFINTNDVADATASLTDCFTSGAKLQYLSSTIPEDDFIEVDSHSLQQISMNALQTLSIDCHYEFKQLPGFFVALEFPNIRRFRLCCRAIGLEDHPWTPSQVQAFLSKLRSLKNLEYLSFTSSSVVSENTMRQLFDAVSQITALDVHMYNYNRLLQTLTLGPDASTHLLPQLRTLILEAWQLEDAVRINKDILSGFLQSRLGISKCLEKVIIYSGYPEVSSDEKMLMQCLQKYVHDGLVVERRIARRSITYRCTWMARDSELQDWPEVHRAYRN